MITILKQLCKEQTYAALYDELNKSTKFLFGRVVAVNETWTAIALLTPEGNTDGILAKQTTDIFRIETGSRYAAKMKILQSYYPEEPIPYQIKEEDIVTSLLEGARQAGQVVTIELGKSGYDDVAGFVEKIRDSICTIRQINEYGDDDGISAVRLRDFTQLSCNSQDEKKLERVWHAKHPQ